MKTDDTFTKKGNQIWKANDGQVGTMAWRAQAPKGSKQKPWVEIHFPESRKINRFRLSANREYYFETDYLNIGTPNPPGFKVSALKPDGTWKEIGKTGWAKQLLNRDPKLKAASNRLHKLIATLAEEGPRHSFVGKFSKPVVTHVLHRGSPENPRDEVPPAGIEILGGDFGLDSSTPGPKRRRAFADWLTQPRPPRSPPASWPTASGTTSSAQASSPPPATSAPPAQNHPTRNSSTGSPPNSSPPTDPNKIPWSTKSIVRQLVTLRCIPPLQPPLRRRHGKRRLLGPALALPHPAASKPR